MPRHVRPAVCALVFGVPLTPPTTTHTHTRARSHARPSAPPPFPPQGYGYLEDRRPAANVDPYTVTRLLIKTILK